jgi:hypothetical protein
VLASREESLPGRDYVGVAELLVAAGNPLEPRFLDAADGRLAAWLEERVTRPPTNRGSPSARPGE